MNKYFHSATRMAIEKCFGQIKRRFPLLTNGLRFRNSEDSAKCILTCFILQNICIIHRDVADFNRAENEQPDGDNNIDENAYSELGKLKREEIKNYMLNL